jgi:hypothetical protein
MEAGREPRVRGEVAVYCVRTDPPNSRRNGVIGLWKRLKQKSATSVDDSRIEGDLMSPGRGTVLSPAGCGILGQNARLDSSIYDTDAKLARCSTTSTHCFLAVRHQDVSIRA